MGQYMYTDDTEFAHDFTGRIQWDRSGVGHCWVTEAPEDVTADVYEALADERGYIHHGATAVVGGEHYRALAAD